VATARDFATCHSSHHYHPTRGYCMLTSLFSSDGIHSTTWNIEYSGSLGSILTRFHYPCNSIPFVFLRPETTKRLSVKLNCWSLHSLPGSARQVCCFIDRLAARSRYSFQRQQPMYCRMSEISVTLSLSAMSIDAYLSGGHSSVSNPTSVRF
jgi:hypothetical protein